MLGFKHTHKAGQCHVCYTSLMSSWGSATQDAVSGAAGGVAGGVAGGATLMRNHAEMLLMLGANPGTSERSEAAAARVEERLYYERRRAAQERARAQALVRAHDAIPDAPDEPGTGVLAWLANGRPAFTLLRAGGKSAFPMDLGRALYIMLAERAQGVERRRVMGSDVPRVEMFYSRVTGREYSFSRRKYRADVDAPLEMLLALDWANELATRYGYRSKALEDVLVNVYAKVSDGVTAHADDEPTIDQSQPIISVSLGTEWPFEIRHIGDLAKPVQLVLRDGDVIIMHPGAQEEYTHAVPKRLKGPALGYTPEQLTLGAPRVNLTFRAYLRPDSRAAPSE